MGKPWCELNLHGMGIINKPNNIMNDQPNPQTPQNLLPKIPSRQGWDKLFALMAEKGDDQLLEDLLSNEFDSEEWDWESI